MKATLSGEVYRTLGTCSFAFLLEAFLSYLGVRTPLIWLIGTRGEGGAFWLVGVFGSSESDIEF